MNFFIIHLLFILGTCVFAQDWSETPVLVDPVDNYSDDNYGLSLSLSNNYLLVGSWLNDHNGNINDGGAAYIFEKNDQGNWVEAQKIFPQSTSSDDYFGKYVSLDNNYAVITRNQNQSSESLFIFERSQSGIWEEKQIINKPATYVEINGNNLFFKTVDGFNVFKRDSNGEWIHTQILEPLSGNANIGFRSSADGDYLALTSQWDDTDENGLNPITQAGAVYLFKKNSSGVWNQIQKIVALERTSYANFGCDVSINGDSLLIGAYHNDTDENGLNSVNNAGAAYIFNKDPSDIWNQTQKIVSPNRIEGLNFGRIVSLSDQFAIIGDDFGSGSIYRDGAPILFKKNENNIWEFHRKVSVPFTSYFGYSLDIDQNHIVIGDPNFLDKGHTWVYSYSSSLSLEDKYIDNAISFYPNPIFNTLNLDLKRAYSSITVSAKDITGKVIIEQSFKSNRQIVFNFEAESGLYFIEVETEKGKFESLKIFKN